MAENQDNIERPTQAGKQWDYDEVIQKGTALERAQLFIAQYDSKQSYSLTGAILTEEQENLLREKIGRSPKAQKIYKELWTLGRECIDFGKTLQSLRKQWQNSAAELATLCEEWRGYERQAALLTQMVKDWKSLKEPLSDEDILARLDNLHTMADNRERQMVYFQYIPEEEKVVANIDGDKTLWHYIQSAQASATYNLRAFKTALELFSDFAYSNVTLSTGEVAFVLNQLPRIMENMLDFPDATIFQLDKNNLQFFSFHLRQLREAGKGDTITPEMERKAVIPDYNQVEVIPEIQETIKENMRRTISAYNPQKYE